MTIASRTGAARRGRRPPAARAARRAPTRPAALPDLDGRERILAVAIRAFSEVGYAGSTTAGIAREAGVTQPLIHHHFGSKEGLWRAAMDVLFSDVPGLDDAAGDLAAPDAFLASIERIVRFVAAHPEVTRVIAREGAAPSPRLDWLVARHLREPFRRAVEVTRVGQHAGLIAPELRADLFLFFVLGASSHLFDVTAFAARSLGIDTTAARTRDDFVGLMRRVLERGIFTR